MILTPTLPQEKITKMKANEAKLEADKRRLKEILDAAESRCTKVELLRRSLDGELQRMKLVLSDREMEIQVLQDRGDMLQRQVVPPAPGWPFPRGSLGPAELAGLGVEGGWGVPGQVAMCLWPLARPDHGGPSPWQLN